MNQDLALGICAYSNDSNQSAQSDQSSSSKNVDLWLSIEPLSKPLIRRANTQVDPSLQCQPVSFAGHI